MADYISKHEAYTKLKDLEAAYIYPPVKEAYATAARRIDEIKAADVQPVDRWISVNEALPIYDGLVLIYYNDKRIRLGFYTEDGWYSDEGNPIMEQPDFWVRIPEPPKQ